MITLRRFRPAGALSAAVLLISTACTDDRSLAEGDGVDDTGDPPTRPGTSAPSAVRELDPPGTRSLDLSWEEECAWLGHHSDDVEADESGPLVLELEMLPEHLEELYSRSPRSDDRLPGAYRIDGQGPLLSLREPGVRFRGNTARGLPKKSFNLRFQEDVPGLGTDRVNLNAMYTDPSFVRERLAMRMFAAAGLPTPRTRYVDLHLNGAYEGLYLYVQRVDERLLEEHGLPTDDITLVRDRARDVLGENVSLFSRIDLPLGNRVALVAELQELFDARGTPDWGAVADLVEWVYDPAPDGEDQDSLVDWLDLDNVIDWYALHVLTGDMDAFSDDYWLYRSGAGEPWRLIPWDKDLSFGTHFVREHGGVTNHLFHYEWDIYDRVTSRNDLLARALEPSSVRTIFEERLDELMTSQFPLTYACEELAAAARIIGDRAAREPAEDAFVLHPGNHFAAPGDHDLHLARILDFLQLRYAFVDRQLDPVDGAPYTASARIKSDDLGRSVLLTDPEGWTIARLDVLEVEQPGAATIAVEPSDRSPDVDRVWTIEMDGAVRAQLSLYYRNTLLFGDWYRGGDDGTEPVGGQRDLALVELGGGDEVFHTSVSNPHSNRVMAEVTLDGTTTFVLKRAPS